MRKVLFLFGQLNDDDVEWMLKAGTKRHLEAGETLIHQGHHTNAVYILLTGKLAVRLKPKRGEERDIAHLNAGEIVGEMSFIDSRPPSATVMAVEESTVFALDKGVLGKKLGADQGFAARFYRALAMYLSTTVRERHRALEFGNLVVGGDEEVEEWGEEGELEGGGTELEGSLMDGVSLAGERFGRMVRGVMVV